jgi:hypothetical protein
VATSYEEAFDPLRGIYLEDSWVLDLVPTESSIAFELDAVLTPEHPEYRGPRPGEPHDYRRARLLVTGDRATVELSGLPAAVDVSGEADLGHIDAWAVDDTGTSKLTGDWGSAEVTNARVQLNLV